MKLKARLQSVALIAEKLKLYSDKLRKTNILQSPYNFWLPRGKTNLNPALDGPTDGQALLQSHFIAKKVQTVENIKKKKYELVNCLSFTRSKKSKLKKYLLIRLKIKK